MGKDAATDCERNRTGPERRNDIPSAAEIDISIERWMAELQNSLFSLRIIQFLTVVAPTDRSEENMCRFGLIIDGVRMNDS